MITFMKYYYPTFSLFSFDRFLDMNHNGTLDETRFEQINCLRNITLAAVLKENNIRNYEIPWSAIENDGLER